MTINAPPDLSDESRQAYEWIAKEMFAVFRPGGQPESAAKENADKLAREYVKHGKPDVDPPLLRLLKR